MMLKIIVNEVIIKVHKYNGNDGNNKSDEYNGNYGIEYEREEYNSNDGNNKSEDDGVEC